MSAIVLYFERCQVIPTMAWSSSNSLRYQFRDIVSRIDNLIRHEDWEADHIEVGIILNSCLLKLKLLTLDVGNADDVLPQVEDEGGLLTEATTDLLQMIAGEVAQTEAALFKPADRKTDK